MEYTPEATRAHTERALDWLHAPDLWVLFLLVVPAVAGGVWWIYRSERGTLVPWQRLLLAGIRAALIFAVVTFLCEPILTRENVQTASGHLIVLVDDSFSMGIRDRWPSDDAAQKVAEAAGIPHEGDPSRIELVTGFLGNERIDFLRKLREKAHVHLIAGADGTRTLMELPRLDEGEAMPPGAVRVAPIELRGKVSRIGDTIHEAVNELRGETISAVVLMSDGRDNGGVLSPEESARRLAKRGIPVFTVGVGNPEEPKDVRLFNLEVPEVVLEGDVVSVDFKLTSKGFEGERARTTFTLLDPSGVMVEKGAPRNVLLEGGEQVQSERLEFVPHHSGQFLARVAVGELDGELFHDNNSIEKPITILSQKIKVLYVEGPPRYEYRYLENALTLDPTMETQVLLLSADASFPQEASPGLPSLRGFPPTRTALLEYHLIILGDLPPSHPALPDGWMDWVVDFVDEIGGGVIFIAGRDMPQKYRGTPLEPLLPVVLEDVSASPFDGRGLEKEFFPRRTGEGREHPVLQLAGDPERDAILWREVVGREHRGLPGFHWYHRVKKVERGGVALAVHGDPGEDHLKYGPRPILAYQYFGRGRTFISLVDSTWRWRRNVGNQYFYKFWGQAARFTSQGRLLGKTPRFSISTDQRDYTLGGNVHILARVLDKEFKPTEDPECTILHTWGKEDDPGRQQLSAVQVPARPTYYEAVIEASELGEHKLALEERGEEVASTTYRVLVPQLEYEEPRLDAARLQEIAALTRGSYHDLGTAARIADEVPLVERTIPISAEQDSLWDTTMFLLWFAAAVTLEWVLRKVFRLL